MTSQKGAPVVLGVKRGTPRAPSPSMHSEGKPLHASPPSWPGCAHWLRGWAPMRSASKTCARSATSLDPQHGVVVMETWRQCIRSIRICICLAFVDLVVLTNRSISQLLSVHPISSGFNLIIFITLFKMVGRYLRSVPRWLLPLPQRLLCAAKWGWIHDNACHRRESLPWRQARNIRVLLWSNRSGRVSVFLCLEINLT